MPPITGILSDCDGVIVDSEVVADALMVEVLQQAFGVADLVIEAGADGLFESMSELPATIDAFNRADP